MNENRDKIGLSVAVSFNNEEKNIESLYSRLKGVLEAAGKEYELIFVDDASRDNTFSKLCSIHENDPKVSVIRLNRNYGQNIGLFIGMDLARGETIITLDGDLQHDPAQIPLFLEKISSGYDVVNGKKTRREDCLFFRIIPALIAKKVVAMIFKIDCQDINSNYRAYRSDFASNMKIYGECLRFTPLLACREKFSICEIGISCGKRLFGKTHYSFWGRLKRLIRDLHLLRAIRSNDFRKARIVPENCIAEKRSRYSGAAR